MRFAQRMNAPAAQVQLVSGEFCQQVLQQMRELFDVVTAYVRQEIGLAWRRLLLVMPRGFANLELDVVRV